MEHLNSALKIFAVLEALCSGGKKGVSELSVKLKLGKSSVHRFLSALKELGYVSKDPDSNKYFATLKLFQVGSMVRGRNGTCQ